jgi:hypothetical protein
MMDQVFEGEKDVELIDKNFNNLLPLKNLGTTPSTTKETAR